MEKLKRSSPKTHIIVCIIIFCLLELFLSSSGFVGKLTKDFALLKISQVMLPFLKLCLFCLGLLTQLDLKVKSSHHTAHEQDLWDEMILEKSPSKKVYKWQRRMGDVSH
jgi:hypothetical protein